MAYCEQAVSALSIEVGGALVLDTVVSSWTIAYMSRQIKPEGEEVLYGG